MTVTSTPHLPATRPLDRPARTRIRQQLTWLLAVAAVVAMGILAFSVIDDGSPSSGTTGGDIGPGLLEHGSIAQIDHATGRSVAEFNAANGVAITAYRGEGSREPRALEQTVIDHGSVSAIDHATPGR